MFIPKSFAQTDQDKIIQLINEYPLASISYVADGEPNVCHVPVLHIAKDGKDKLITHVARANPIWRYTDTPWLLVFMGADHYISANWYASKQQTHQEVPTYNYQAVHIKAQANIINEPDMIKSVLAQTTDFFERHLAKNHEHTPWQLSDAPSEFVDKMCKALVAIELEILSVQAQFKLSQNKPACDQQGVIGALHKLGTAKAEKMAQLIDAYKMS